MNEREKLCALDLLRQQCLVYATPDFRQALRNRSRQSLRRLPGDREFMRRICVAIAYSQGARSAQIEKLIADPVFPAAFADFDPAALAKCKPDAILKKYWSRLGHFRFKGKIREVVQCAQALNAIIHDHGSCAHYLTSFLIPQRIRTTEHLNQFWAQFDVLQQDLQRREMPFFRSTTSLLQLLLDLDYDSVKPDLIIMRLARRIGIVQRETGDAAFRQCVRFLQEYSIKKSCRAAELDWALLAFGGQSGASQSLTEKFCPSRGPCSHEACPLGANRLCIAHQPVLEKSQRCA
jgi:3-methyladenine DNA glycosylase Tag